MMTVYEPPVRNSGIIGGKFLERTRVAKPGCPPDQPQFYGPEDFYIGAVIDVFKHRFIITNADEYVLKYMEDHTSQFSSKNFTTKDKVIDHVVNLKKNINKVLQFFKVEKNAFPPFSLVCFHPSHTGTISYNILYMNEVSGMLDR